MTTLYAPMALVSDAPAYTVQHGPGDRVRRWLTYGALHHLRVGDRVLLSDRSNRFRYRVTTATETTVDISEHVRPSRGHARHIRRRKQEQRK